MQYNKRYDNANEMLTFTPANASTRNMTYDNNGNLTSVTNNCGTTNYTWNVRNQLVGINGYRSDCSPLTALFKYDALGRRIEKTINGVTTLKKIRHIGSIPNSVRYNKKVHMKSYQETPSKSVNCNMDYNMPCIMSWNALNQFKGLSLLVIDLFIIPEIHLRFLSSRGMHSYKYLCIAFEFPHPSSP